MSLSTIKPSDAPPKHKKTSQRPTSSLRTDDIDGARPQLRGYQCINKPELSNYTLDIEKAYPRPLHPDLNKPCRNLSTSDIDKAQPSLSTFKTARVTNPLNPEYKLPSFVDRPVTPPKFVRDSHGTGDIEKAQPEKCKKWATRDQISVKDIEGARPKAELVLQKPNFMEVKDINEPRFVTSRFTNPLEPTYTVRDEQGLTEIGPIDGSRAKPVINTERPVHRRNIDNQDIDGSKTNTVGHPTLQNKERNYSKDPLDTSDIQGTTAGTHKTGLKTSRVTNPLVPVYTWTTEDPAVPVQVLKKEEKPENNENALRFWGITPNVSRASSVPNTKPPSRPQTSKVRTASFRKNVEKFFDATGEDKSGFIENSAEKFFDNPRRGLEDKFLNVQNPNSIYRVRKEVKVIEPMHFKENVNRFCGVHLERPWSSGSYKFKLSRGEIGRPE